jgi:hypothetical protein
VGVGKHVWGETGRGRLRRAAFLRRELRAEHRVYNELEEWMSPRRAQCWTGAGEQSWNP